MTDASQLKTDIEADIAAAQTLDALEAIRVAAIGKKGSVSALMKTLGKMSPEERQVEGPKLNALKRDITDAVAARKSALEEAALEAQLAAEQVDVTLPVQTQDFGTIHPVSQVMDELSEIFADMGFAVAEGPEIEDEFHNFDALNLPAHHPARAMHATFYFPEKEDGSRLLLRTHTSPVQIRTMLSQEPPIRIIAPGKTYRSDSDATHTPMFHQVEGLVIEEGIHMGHLKGCLEAFVKAFFQLDSIDMRFRASFFPFTEPSAEVDIRCSFEGGTLTIGEGEDWLEIGGCGMVHPRVMTACNLDPERYQGFAFGCGIDRLAMLKYGMTDLRPFFDGDQRWLKHYGFSPLAVPTLAGGLS
ncbi:MAG: phenylalanine--tRNA ligase subunit alpha [Sphingomonadales bacterium]